MALLELSQAGANLVEVTNLMAAQIEQDQEKEIVSLGQFVWGTVSEVSNKMLRSVGLPSYHALDSQLLRAPYYVHATLESTCFRHNREYETRARAYI